MDRTVGIGASEVPILAEASPWSTPVEVWLAKTHQSGPRDDTPQMSTGRELEVPILRMTSGRMKLTLVHNRQTFRHPDWPTVPLYATPDGFDRHRRFGIEVKYVAHRFGDWTGGGVPDYVAIQAHAQMAVLPRLQRVVVAALVGGGFRTVTIDRSDAECQRIADLVADWWTRYVVGDVAPPALSDADEWLALRARVRTIGRQERLADPDENRIAADLLAAMTARDDLDESIDQLRKKLALGADGADVAGVGWTAKWSERATVDWRGLAKHRSIPDDAIAQWTSRVPSFTFRRSTAKGTP